MEPFGRGMLMLPSLTKQSLYTYVNYSYIDSINEKVLRALKSLCHQVLKMTFSLIFSLVQRAEKFPFAYIQNNSAERINSGGA